MIIGSVETPNVLFLFLFPCFLVLSSIVCVMFFCLRGLDVKVVFLKTTNPLRIDWMLTVFDAYDAHL